MGVAVAEQPGSISSAICTSKIEKGVYPRRDKGERSGSVAGVAADRAGAPEGYPARREVAGGCAVFSCRNFTDRVNPSRRTRS